MGPEPRPPGPPGPQVEDLARQQLESVEEVFNRLRQPYRNQQSRLAAQIRRKLRYLGYLNATLDQERDQLNNLLTELALVQQQAAELPGEPPAEKTDVATGVTDDPWT